MHTNQRSLVDESYCSRQLTGPKKNTEQADGRQVRELRSNEHQSPLAHEAVVREAGHANGFLEGVNVRKESWAELFEDEDDRGLIMPMILLALANHPDPETRSQLPPPEQRTEILEMLAPALLGIYEYFKQRRTPAVAATPVRRVQPKVGRNEPCPCGSGEKYKNCCLRRAH